MDLHHGRFVRAKGSTETLLKHLCCVPGQVSRTEGPFWKIDGVERSPSWEALKLHRDRLPAFERRARLPKQRKCFLQSSPSHQRNDLHEFGWHHRENSVCVCVAV